MSKAGGSGKGKGSTRGSDAQGPSRKSLQEILKQHQVKNSTKFLEGLASIGIRVPKEHKEHKGKGKGKGKAKRELGRVFDLMLFQNVLEGFVGGFLGI